jgi:hypothetical protein
MNRFLLLSLPLLLLAACAPMAPRSTAPAAPAGPAPTPLSEDSALGNCDGNVLMEFAADVGKGSSTLRCTSTIRSVAADLDRLDPATTLLVLDIDDTLLTSDTLFGSDSWYEWETALADGTPGKPQCEYDMIALHYEASTQSAVEGKPGVDLVNGLTVAKLLLTSRNPYYRGGTERELLRAGYQLPGNFLAETYGTSWMEASSKGPVPVVYSNGILMTTGRDKGKMLLKLFTRLGELGHPQKFSDIVLVDDGYKNINAMHNALHAEIAGARYNFHGYLYKGVSKQRDPKKLKATRSALQKWQQLIHKVYRRRSDRWNMQPAQCG